LVVTVFKHYAKGLGFPKHERLDKGGPKAPDKPILYPLEKTQITLLELLVVIVFKYSVNGLGFPKHERLKKSISKKASRKKHLEKSISKKASRKKHLEKSIAEKTTSLVSS
jgi:hypothetical protein